MQPERCERVERFPDHMVRGSLKYVSYKGRKVVARDLRTIYQAPTLEAAEEGLAPFEAG